MLKYLKLTQSEHCTLVENVMSKKAPTIARVTPKDDKEWRLLLICTC